MSIMKTAMLCSAWLVQLGSLQAQADRSLYVIYDTQNKKEITLSELAAALEPIDIVLFGEEHNDSVAHVLQLELLKAMDERYDRVALSMEMFVSDEIGRAHV